MASPWSRFSEVASCLPTIVSEFHALPAAIPSCAGKFIPDVPWIGPTGMTRISNAKSAPKDT